MIKNLLGDKEFAKKVFNDLNRFTSANSISLGRLLPQMIYPFFAYSRVAENGEKMSTSIPCGNFGDIRGTVLAKEMGLPVSKIICGVNENKEFPRFLYGGRYRIEPSKTSPSSAMNVSHPSNLARLIEFYNGHMHDERDIKTGKIVKQGVITKMPDMDEMKKDICSISISNPEHYETIKKVFEEHNVILDQHGAIAWNALDIFFNGNSNLSVIYETADPGKFSDDVKKAIGITPEIPQRMQEQSEIEERIYTIESEPEYSIGEGLKLSDAQIKEAKDKIKELFLKK